MKALPPRFGEQRHKADTDPEGKVCFTIRPLDPRMRQQITQANQIYEEDDSCGECGRKKYRVYLDRAGMLYDTVAFGLVSIEGLEYEDGTLFELKKEKVKLVDKEVERVTSEILDFIPSLLLQEIAGQINIASILTEEEVEDIKNSLGSPSPDSTNAGTATETNSVASTTAETGV